MPICLNTSHPNCARQQKKNNPTPDDEMLNFRPGTTRLFMLAGFWVCATGAATVSAD